MQYHFPDYYYTFQCIGSLCPDTCCAGWNIEIDQASLSDYKKAIQNSRQGWHLKPQDPFFTTLKKSIDFRRRTFRLQGRRCALLTEDNLCSIYLHMGKNSLCRTCRTYPRHQEEFGNIREISLSLSCPEAARIILSQSSRPLLVSRQTNMDCPPEQLVDENLLTWLLTARERILDIIWEPDRSLELSVSMALAFAHDLQRRHIDQRFFNADSFNFTEASMDLEKLAQKYLAPGAGERFLSQVRQLQLRKSRKNVSDSPSASDTVNSDVACSTGHSTIHSTVHGTVQSTAQSTARTSLLSDALLSLYSTLEPIIEDWLELLSRCHALPVHNTLPEKQLLTYFIQVYFPGAIYDDDIFGKMQFAAASWLMVRMLCGALSSDADSAADADTAPDTAPDTDSTADADTASNTRRNIPLDALWIQAASLYSRQTENSEQNLNTLFDAFRNRRPFQLFSFLMALNGKTLSERNFS